MKEIVFCQRCKLEIKKGQKVAGMHTYNKFPQVSDEKFFHFNCFIEWRDEKIFEAGKKVGERAMKKIMPKIKPLAENIANQIRNNEEVLCYLNWSF